MFKNFINIKNIFSFLRSAIYLCTSFGYFFALNGFMLGLCWGHNLHFGQLGPFDVLLQSLPIVSSHLLSSLPSSLSPYLPFVGLSHPACGEFIHMLS